MPSIITVGIDFGTTFSGAAWAISKRPADIHVITNWESEYNGCSDRGKCPTQLQYGTIDHQSPWGYNIPADKDVVRWFKLLLVDEADLPSAVVKDPQFRAVRKQQKRLKISPTELVACFLRSLWKHCMENITRALGSSEVANCKIHIVMTVPAIWPHYVQPRMKSAAELAGMLQERDTSSALQTTTLEFLSEPEAAALAALAEMHPRPDIEQGDTIIVCDAGGGTADLISYQVDKASSFKLGECVAGQGGLCGGIFVDQNFDDLITDKMGGSPWKGMESADKRKFMKESWENGIKSQFSGNHRQFFAEVPEGYLPDGAMGKRKRLQTIELDRDDLLSVFSPVVNKICDLVENQKDAITGKQLSAPKFIILVGGFGCCRYLFDQLVQAYPDSTILNPPSEQSWTAVCRGAVRHALIRKTVGKNGKRATGSKAIKPGSYIVQSRICRMGYGFKQNEAWNPLKHRPEDKVWDSLEEMYEASNQMNWFLKKGDTLDGALPSTHEFYRLLSAGDELDIENKLYFCTSDVLPCRKTNSVEKLCSIKWNKSVDLSNLKAKTNSAGQVYYKLSFDIQVTVNGPELRIEVYHNRRKVAAGEPTFAIYYNDKMGAWKANVRTAANDFKTANQTGDWSKFLEKKNNPTLDNDELKKRANDFPEIKVVLEDTANYHQGIIEEYQAVTDDLESGSADKPTAIERVKAQGEKLTAESIANIDASTERVIALIEGLPEDQQDKAAEYWVALLYGFAASWSEVMTQVERIFEFVVEWLSQVWEQVKASWASVKGTFTQIWAQLGGMN